jgi:hypothetical protein
MRLAQHRSVSQAAGQSRLPARRGSMTMELILLFPILMTLFLAMIEFSLILHSRQQLLAASREGARVAAIGADQQEIEQAVLRYLGSGRLGDSEVTITDFQGNELQASQQVPSGEAVAVWVRLPTAHAVPDLLRFVGYSIRNDEIVARTVMRRE